MHLDPTNRPDRNTINHAGLSNSLLNKNNRLAKGTPPAKKLKKIESSQDLAALALDCFSYTAADRKLSKCRGIFNNHANAYIINPLLVIRFQNKSLSDRIIDITIEFLNPNALCIEYEFSLNLTKTTTKNVTPLYTKRIIINPNDLVNIGIKPTAPLKIGSSSSLRIRQTSCKEPFFEKTLKVGSKHCSSRKKTSVYEDTDSDSTIFEFEQESLKIPKLLKETKIILSFFASHSNQKYRPIQGFANGKLCHLKNKIIMLGFLANQMLNICCKFESEIQQTVVSKIKCDEHSKGKSKQTFILQPNEYQNISIKGSDCRTDSKTLEIFRIYVVTKNDEVLIHENRVIIQATKYAIKKKSFEIPNVDEEIINSYFLLKGPNEIDLSPLLSIAQSDQNESSALLDSESRAEGIEASQDNTSTAIAEENIYNLSESKSGEDDALDLQKLLTENADTKEITSPTKTPDANITSGVSPYTLIDINPSEQSEVPFQSELDILLMQRDS